MAELVARVSAGWRKLHMAAPGEKIVVGVSGGADSVALLDVLDQARADLEVELVVAHLDHGLRSEGPDEAAFVADLAASRGLPAYVKAADVARAAAERGLGVEEAARQVRYSFLLEVADKSGAAAVAVAHNADDQAETVLMNIIRGTGLDGLAGMSPVAPYPVSPARRPTVGGTAGETSPPRAPRLLRPLLGLERTEILTYLAERGLTWRDDPTNLDPAWLRNRVRLEVLPLLEGLNPRLRRALCRLAAAVEKDREFLDSHARSEFDRCVAVDHSGATINIQALTSRPLAIKRRVVRMALAAAGADLREAGLEVVDGLLDMLASQRADSRLSLPGRLIATRAADSVHLGATQLPPPPLPGSGPVHLRVPGETTLPSGWRFVARLRPRFGGPVQSGVPGGALRAQLDSRVVAQGLVIRTRQPGDRMRPLGMHGHSKSLQDLYVDAKLPRQKRDSWPVVALSDDVVVWVPGVHMAEEARLTAASTEVVELEAHPPGAA